MTRHANRLRKAFDSRRLDRFIRLMDPEVTWRGVHHPGEDVPMCHDRREVRAFLADAIAHGRDGHPQVVGESGDSVVVDPRPHPRSTRHLHQVFTFRGGLIVLMQDYPDRGSAMAAIAPWASRTA